MYEMTGNMFLFEFPNRFMAEQILQGDWSWKKYKLHLEWWTHIARCIPKSQTKETCWIRAMRIPLHLWSQKIFKEIGDLCGGWLATEEETDLKNHLKWARIKIAGDGRKTPNEVGIERDGIKFFIPIWAESQTRYELKTQENEQCSEIERYLNNQLGCTLWQITDKGNESGQLAKGSSSMNQSSKVTNNELKSYDFYLAAQVIFNDLTCEFSDDIRMKPFIEEMGGLSYLGEKEFSPGDPIPNENHERMPKTTLICCSQPKSGLEIARLEQKAGEQSINTNIGNDHAGSALEHLKQFSSIQDWEIEEVNPIAVQQHNPGMDKDMDATLWVHQNMIKLGKMFGVDFQGHEEEALEFLMQIDNCRQVRRVETELEVKKQRFKGSLKLKGLTSFDVKFKSDGKRSRGRDLSIILI
ncbi:uncharacterized protein [Nicotiana sylvestris]|uniref:uncharacterized protein isoform X1 n=1 Tax=Nicotiana sylvestris TaxID=4096 RepID=UPI00388C59A1